MFKEEKMCVDNIITVVFEQHNPDTQSHIYYSNKSRNACDLVYVLSGESITCFDGIRLHKKENTVMFLPQSQQGEHFVEFVKPSAYIDVIFATAPPIDTKAFVLNCACDAEIRSLFEKIYNVWVTKKEGYYCQCMSILYEILAALRRKSNIYLPQSEKQKVQNGIDYLHSVCFQNDIDYKRASLLCGMSYSYFKQLFLKIYGIPPVKYITQLKLERAKELLITGIYTVNEIAMSVGYNDVYYFSKSFKKLYGMSPSVYAKVMCQNFR